MRTNFLYVASLQECVCEGAGAGGGGGGGGGEGGSLKTTITRSMFIGF